MVRQYYVPQITALSSEELRCVLSVVVPPVSLIGGWAVHLHVDRGFSREHGRGYIGSRDIDIGVHVEPDWTPEVLVTEGVGKTIESIENLGYTKSRFGYLQHFIETPVNESPRKRRTSMRYTKSFRCTST